MKRTGKRLLSLMLSIFLLLTMLPRLERPAAAAKIVSGTCGENVKWNLSKDGTLTITGNGPMMDYAYNDPAPWYDQCASVRSVIIGDGVTSIGRDAFADCVNLTDITIPKGVTDIGDSAFNCCSSLTSVMIPEGVTTIRGSTFMNCSDLTEIILPEGLTTIEYAAFNDCVSLREVNFPESLTTVHHYAFADCESLREITFPAALSFIGQFAIASCEVDSITFLGSAPTIGSWVFSALAATVYYPCGDPTWSKGIMQNYQGDMLWQENHKYVDGVCSVCGKTRDPYSGSCGKDLQWQLDDQGTLKVTGTGNMKHYASPTDTPWYEMRPFIRAVEIGEGVTSIGAYGFAACSNLTKVTIGSGVTIIGRYAFKDCKRLTSVVLPEGTTTISWAAFLRCSSLASVTIPESVTTIESYAFNDCNSLISVTIPASVAAIGSGVFVKTRNMTVVTFLGSAPSLPDGCLGLSTVYYPCGDDSWTKITEKNTSNVTWKPWHTFGENGYCTQCRKYRELVVNITRIGSDRAASAVVGIYNDSTLLDSCRVHASAYKDLATVSYPFGSVYHLKWESQSDVFNSCFTAAVNGAVVAYGSELNLKDGEIIHLIEDCDHQYRETTTPSNCVKEGKIVSLCILCGDSSVRNIPPVAEHSYDNGVCIHCGEPEPIHLTGDLNGDNRLDIADVSCLYAHVKGTLPLDAATLPYADTTGDGTVDIADTARLYAHVKGTNP